jgi:methionine sulfoxide reductase heme-binding subunit
VGKAAVFAASLLPFGYLLWAAFADALGANPAEYLLRSTGDWTLRFLCLTLAVTPVRKLSGLNWLLRYRRMLGLFTFFYGVVHLLCYAGFDMGFDLAGIVQDIPKRPFILAGFTALLLMLPLAATSFNAAIRLMGAKRWQLLHRLVYVVAVAALLHFFWMRGGKNNFAEPIVYLAIIGTLLGWRLWSFATSRVRSALVAGK